MSYESIDVLDGNSLAFDHVFRCVADGVVTWLNGTSRGQMEDRE